MKIIKHKNIKWMHWWALWTVSIAVACLYVFMEWIFFATKSSFMNTLGFGDELKILMIAPLPFIFGFTVIACILWGIGQITKHTVVRFVLLSSARIAPAFIFGATIFLLIDNFTYTLFDFGVESVHGFWRALYFMVFISLATGGYIICSGIEQNLVRKNLLGPARLIAVILTGAFGVVLATETDFSALKKAASGNRVLQHVKMPDILLITSDGLSADHLSLYGYRRDTTPFITRYFQGKSLFCENAFPNAASTTGSIASMLTGKLPTRIRTYYPPEILKGKDAYEHLPGILRQYGYFNIDINVREYVDAYDLNMLNSFDLVNERSYSKIQTWMPAILGQNTNFFLAQTVERFGNRLLYAMGLKDFIYSYGEVARFNKTGIFSDETRVDALLSSIKQAKQQPFFAHVHFAGTHGGHFYLKKQIFSRGQTQTDVFMRDFYDDAILQFDQYVEQIINVLKSRGKINNTIIIIASDHGKGCTSGERIPLMFLFPGSSHATRIRTNTQNLDIAPTLLHYLKIPKPDWMNGRSLLNMDTNRFYPIFSAQVNFYRINTDVWKVNKFQNNPPFYSLGNVAVNICNKVYRMYVDEPGLTISTVQGHTDPCRDDQFPSEGLVKKILFDHLEQNGYDISTLKPWL